MDDNLSDLVFRDAVVKRPAEMTQANCLNGWGRARLKVRFIGSLSDGGPLMAIPVSIPLLDHFALLSDPRQHANVQYLLPEILVLVLAATIAGADDFVETTLWGAEYLAFLRRFYPYDNAFPATIHCATCSPH
jgi:hypothetical protein